MASKVSGVIEKINVSGTERAIASTAYGYCETAANTAAKTVDMTDFKLYEGVTIHVKFVNANSAGSPTLNVNSTGAKPIVQYGTTAATTTSETGGWYAGAVLTLTYDGTSWVRDQGFNTNSQANYGNITTAGKIGTGNNLVVTSSGTVQAGAIISSAISSQATSTKFLREDGTWAAPSYTTNTDAKVAQSSNAEDKEFPIILKNSNNTTNETNGVKYVGGVTVNPSNKTITADEFIGQLRIDRLKPIITKTYTAPLYNATSGANFFQTFATVSPADYNAIWIAHYRITITASGHSDYTEICDVSISGRSNTYYTYKVYNSLVTYSIYQHVYLRSSAAATPHELGYRMQGSYGADTIQKVVKVELLEQINCTVTLLDSLKLYANATPSGYAGWTQITATSNGLQETGDANDYGYYILSNGFKGKAGSNKVYRYCLFARTGDGTYESFVMQDNTVATTKTVNPHGFVPDGKIYWNSNNAVYNEGTLNISAYQQYHVIDYRYSFNFNNTFLPDYCETYVVYTYNEDDGLLYLDSTQWLAAALPTTADNKIYQRLGSKYYTGTSNYYQGSLLLDNPYYEYKNGKIRTWAPSTRGIKNITRSGTTFTATRDDGSTFTFTQRDNNTTYTFADGTNGFTVTPSGGTAQTVTVTPSITNNITGTGTANYLTKFTDTNTIGNSGLTTDANNNLTIPGTIYFGSNTSTATGKPILAYNSNNTKFGIWYKEGTSDIIAFSASGNGDSTTNADFAIEGGGKLYNKGSIIPNTGNNTGSVGSTTTPVYIDAGVIKAGTALKDLAYIAKPTSNTTTTFLRGDGTWQTALTAHRTYTAFTGKPTDNQSPGFGDTFTIQQISQNTTGQVSGTDRTVTIPSTAASASTAGLVNTEAQTFSGVKTFDNGLHIYGTISTQGTSSTAGTMYPGGAYHSGHNSIVLHGDTAGVSGIGFTSEKATKSGTTTNINSSSDRAFIQYHAYGVTAAAEGTAPTLATSGELGTLVIGVGNDATDTIRLQAPGTAGILHQIGATAYPIPHTTNTNGSVGGAGTPVYVEAGVIKAGTALGASAYHPDSYFALASHGTHVTTATVKSALGTVSTTAKKFLKDTGDWTQVDWGDLTGVPSSFAPSAHEHNRLNGIGRLTSAAAISYNPGASQGLRLVWNIYDSTSRTNDATNSPSFDAGVINIPWDWGGYNGQIAISNTIKDNTRMQIRSASHTDNGENANPRYTPDYGAWREVVTATKATKVGDTNKPVYINATGQATAISYEINKSVPSNAVFTDHYAWGDITSKPDTATRWPKWNEISQSGAESLNEGSSNVTDNTEILTSYASDNGFADTNGKGIVYRRDAIKVYNYIKGKLDSVYATQSTVNGLLAAADAMVFKGVINATNALPNSHNAGDTYRVGTAGTYPIVDSNGKYCEVGTLIICIADGTAATPAHWTAVETNEDGAVIGPTSSTDNAIVRFDGTTGRIIQNSGVTIDDSNNLTVPGTALKITNTSGAKFILMGNQDSSGANKPTILEAANGTLYIGNGTDWSANNGGTLSTALYMAADRKIGIGTTSPSELLHIVGNLLLGNSGSKAIYYQGTKSKNAMITFLDNTSDTYGNGIKIGGGGTVVVGAGESAANLSVTAGNEILYLTSDGAINIEAGGNTIANRVGIQVTAAGHIIPVKTEAANNNKQNLGASDNRWATIYSTKFNGVLTPSSWLDGQRYQNGAFNIADYSNTGSYNPWMRATNTWSSGAETAKVGRWFSFGTLGASFYWMGSTTTRTENSYDHALRYDVSSGKLYCDGTEVSLAGHTHNYKPTQTAVDSGAAATNKWVSRIEQNTNGVITATMGTLDTSGAWSGNAATATKLKDNATNTTRVFYRGDNTWSNILKQTSAAVLGIDTNSKIGTAVKDLHFTVGSGSGTGINDGNAGGITIGTDTVSYGGIYWQSSGSYGLRLHFATTGSFANGAYTRMLIAHDGKVGIGTLSPDKLLTVNGEIKGTALYLKTAASDPSLSAGARIEFSYPDGQPVVLSYTPNDAYRAPAGLKVMGGTSATPAWFEVEGSLWSKDYHHFNSSNIEDASLIMGMLGKKPTATTTDGNTTYSGAVTGTSILTLGNNKVSSNSASGVDNNAQGYLRLYSSGSAYAQITAYSGDKTRLYPEEGISIPIDKIGIMFRPSSSGYYTHFSYQTTGNEALVMATQNAVTSFIFINGESYANVSSTRWRSLTPALQIKNNSVIIGKLIDTGVTPSYKFEVKGNSYFDGTLGITNSISITKAAECGIEVNNTQSTNPNQVAFIVGSSGNGGIYSRKHSKWIVYSDANGNIVLNGNANSATAVAAALATTTKTYLLGTSTAITSTASNVNLTGDTGVYLTTTVGELSAVRHSWNVSGTEKAYTYYNTTDNSIDFIFI